jgi:hypothetical protein
MLVFLFGDRSESLKALTQTKRAVDGVLKFRRAAIRAACSAVSASAAAIALAPRAAAQGCAMCYQSAAGSGSHSIVALQHGILLLLIPSAGLFAGIFSLIYSRRNVSR